MTKITVKINNKTISFFMGMKNQNVIMNLVRYAFPYSDIKLEEVKRLKKCL